jgi:hypothetical protein
MIGGGLEEQVTNRAVFVDDWNGAVSLPGYLRKMPLYPRFFRPCSMLYGNMMVYSNGKYLHAHAEISKQTASLFWAIRENRAYRICGTETDCVA